MKTIFIVFLIISVFLLAVSCASAQVTQPPPAVVPTTTLVTAPAATTPQTAQPPSTTPTTAPPVNDLSGAIYDFDTGFPVLAPGQNTPFTQTSGGVTASFSSPSDPAAFSIQNGANTFLKLSQFSGNYLYDNSAVRKFLGISFNYPLTGITLTFATTDSHGPANVEKPSYVKLTAYLNSTGKTSVGIGSATARGDFGSDSFPQGILSFNSGTQPFDRVVIEIIPQPRGGPSFFMDNISVNIASRA